MALLAHLHVSLFVLLWMGTTATHGASFAAAVAGKDAPKCVPITIEECKKVLPYKMTRFPNFIGSENEKDAEADLMTFKPLVTTQCSQFVEFFMCSVYLPMCHEKLPVPIYPCRPLCEKVKNSCSPVLREFGFRWPEKLNCSKFHQENKDESMCMVGPATEDEPVHHEDPEKDREKVGLSTEGFHQPSVQTSTEGFHQPSVQTRCKDKHHEHAIYMNRTGQCVPLCKSSHGYHQDDQETARSALLILSILCISLTIMCVLMICMRRQGLSNLCDRSLVFSSVSFAFSSVVYLFSLVYKDQISCMPYVDSHIFVVAGLQYVPCTVMAILLYYFGTTGRLWWFVLCYFWYKPQPEPSVSASSSSSVFRMQMLTWGVPLSLLIVVLMAQSVQADPLTGICLVGGGASYRPVTQGVFVSLRELLLVLCCLVPLFLGCISEMGSPRQAPYATGLVACFYPVVATVLLVFSFQHLSPSANGLSWVLMTRLLTDPILGILSSLACLLQMTINVYHANRSDLMYKRGYQPAAPQIPQPQIPHHYVAGSSNATMPRYATATTASLKPNSYQ
uniref:Frizzled-4 n=1 Tax=Steinernema glaseri TaxID=37863 RepID=A0A1I7XZS0_9BILA